MLIPKRVQKIVTSTQEICNKASDHEETKDYIANHIKKIHVFGSNIAKRIRTETKIDASMQKPVLDASNKADINEKAVENK